jgi:hypothetical protein
MNAEDFNPMDWHNTKMLDYIPSHFVKVKFRHTDRLRVLEWLQQNTTGRCAIEEVVDNDDDNGSHFHRIMNEEYRIGFEEPADATMYTMFFT